MTRATATRKINVTSVASALAAAAASLSAGQSIRLGDVPAAALYYPGEGSDVGLLAWGNSGYYDPTRGEAGFIGKRSGPNPYHWVLYDEATDSWSNDRPVWDADEHYGHGYDHNAFDPITGTVYFRLFSSKTVYAWDGGWSTLPAWSPSTTGVGGLTWFPGVGLIYNDGAYLLRYNGSAWSTVAALGGSSYHDFSEYNETADVLIFGGGNDSPLRKMTRALSVSAIANSPFTLGASESQGVCISDPGSAALVAFQRGTTNWAEYDIAADEWSTLTQSSGNGSAPQSGTPNLTSNHHVIGIPIPKYGVIMFVQSVGTSNPGSAWLYRHS